MMRVIQKRYLYQDYLHVLLIVLYRGDNMTTIVHLVLDCEYIRNVCLFESPHFSHEHIYIFAIISSHLPQVCHSHTPSQTWRYNLNNDESDLTILIQSSTQDCFRRPFIGWPKNVQKFRYTHLLQERELRKTKTCAEREDQEMRGVCSDCNYHKDKIGL